jgi:anti-anti-sigma factor
MTSELTLRHETTPGGITLVTCVGVLDAHTSSKLDQLMDQLAGRGAMRVAVNLEGVTYVASAGVGVFLGRVNAMREQGGDLVIIYPRHVQAEAGGTGLTEGYDVLEVFSLLGLDEAIPVVASLADAETRLA